MIRALVMLIGQKKWVSIVLSVPQQLREYFVAPSVAPEAAAAMAHPPDEQFADPTDWETEFFSELEPQKILSSSGTLQTLHPETQEPCSQP